MSVASEPMLLTAYIEDSCMKLWDHAFINYFRGPDSFQKGGDFVGFNGSDLVVRRVLFRYVINRYVLSINFVTWFSSNYVPC